MKIQPTCTYIRIKRNALKYWKCGAKTLTFLFWATLYMIVMKMTIFKSNVNTPVKDWPYVPDNYTEWLIQQSVAGEDIIETKSENIWTEPDENTIKDLQDRVKRIREVCQKREILDQNVNSKEFFIDHEHNLVWCNVFKAASSSWLYNFNILGGYTRTFLATTRHNPLTLARKVFPRPNEEELSEAVNSPGYLSLLVVREPFVRLLSAYRDKLENITPLYYRSLAKAIVEKYRTNTTQLFGKVKSYGPTFYEFVAHLIDTHKLNTSSARLFDEHWAPYYQFCTPCAVNFTVIAKVETHQRDTAYVIHELGLNELLGVKVANRRTRLRTVMNKSRDGKNTSALMKYYFKQLDRKMLNNLLEIYGTDFEMFGYDPEVYKQYVRK